MGVLFTKVAGVWEPVGSVPPPVVQSITAGPDTTVDATNPSYPIISSTAAVNEVTIAAIAPTDTSEVWVVPPGVRPESVLYVKDGAGWDYIGGNDITATNQRLDAMKIALNREPLGVVAVATPSYADGGAPVNGVSLSGSFFYSTTVGRRYRFVFDMRAVTPNVNTRFRLTLRRRGVDSGDRWFQLLAGNGYTALHAEWFLDGNGVSTEGFNVTIYLDAGVTITVYSSGGGAYLEDLGVA